MGYKMILTKLGKAFLLLTGMAKVKYEPPMMECCTEQMVGGISYTLWHDLFHRSLPQECLNDCVYTRTNTSSPKFCFMQGDLPTECLSDEPAPEEQAPEEPAPVEEDPEEPAPEEESPEEPAPEEPAPEEEEAPEEPSAKPTADPGCTLSEDTQEYSCQKEKVNFLARENAEVFPGTESWKCCSQKCLDSDTCNFWAWSNKGNKGNCALMTGYGSEAPNNNVISGPKICPDE